MVPLKAAENRSDLLFGLFKRTNFFAYVASKLPGRRVTSCVPGVRVCTLRQVSHGSPSESQPKPFRFNRNSVGSTEAVSVLPKRYRWNRSGFG